MGGGVRVLPPSPRHPGIKAINAGVWGGAPALAFLPICVPRHLLNPFLHPVALGRDVLRRSVIYPLSEEHEHLRPGFRNHNYSPEGG